MFISIDETIWHHLPGEVKSDAPEKVPVTSQKLSPIISSQDIEGNENQELRKEDTPEKQVENPVDKTGKRDHRMEKHKNTSILPPIKYKQ